MSLKLVKNYLSLVFAEGFSKLVVFAAFVYLARLLGPAKFGYVEWSAAVLMCAGLIVDQGLSSYGAREIAKDSARTAHLTAEVVTARLLLAVVGYLVIATVAFWFVRDALTTQLLLIFGLSLWALPFLLNWVFQGHDRMYPVAATQIIRQTTFAVVVFAFVRSSENILWVAAAETAAVTCAALFSIFMFRRAFPAQIPARPALSVKLFREGLPIGISQMFWVVKMFGATLIVGLIAAPEETGWFAGAMRILIGLHAFVWLYHLNLLPSLARAWEQNDGEFSRLISGSLRIVGALSVVGVSIWIVAAPTIITLAYGEKFAGAGGALQWLAGVCAAAAISGHFRFGLIAAGQQNKEMLTAALGAVLAAVFIPAGYYGWGTSGAAAALCFGEIAVLICAWLLARQFLFSRKPLPRNENFLETLPEIV